MWKCGAILLALLSLVSCSVAEGRVTYTGYTVFRVEVKSAEDSKILSQLRNKNGYIFWSDRNLRKHDVDIMVSPTEKSNFISFLQKHNFKYTVLIENYDQLINITKKEINTRRNQVDFKKTVDLLAYRSYGQLVELMFHLSSKSVNEETKNKMIQLQMIGKTYKNREMFMMKVSSDFSKNKPIILLEGGMHAREWAGPPILMYLAQQLFTNYTAFKDILDVMDIYILPVANPDGYEYSRKFDRMWRKTRSDEDGCIGVDGNRNFNYFWGEVGASRDPCSDTYKGAYPFSEKEARNIRDLGVKYGKRIYGYVAVHSYGSFLLYPWGYTSELPHDWVKLDTCARAFAESVYNFSGTNYTYGSSAQVLYEAAGGSDDWFHGHLKTPYAYTLELPAAGNLGFHIPQPLLQGVAAETIAGFKSLINCIIRDYNSTSHNQTSRGSFLY